MPLFGNNAANGKINVVLPTAGEFKRGRSDKSPFISSVLSGDHLLLVGRITWIEAGHFMLYRLEIENFFSIRNAQSLDLTVAPDVPDPDGRYGPIFPGSEQRAPKVIALYGANAS